MSNKTRKWRSAIAMVLVICMMFSIFPVAAFADSGVNPTPDDPVNYDVNGDGIVNYVSLGASNVNGYGMHGYLGEDVYEYPLLKEQANIYGYKQDTPGSYPVLIKKYLEEEGYGVELSQLAISSMRAEEVRFMLDESYKGDAYTDWRFCDIPGYDNRNSQNWFYLAGKLEWNNAGNSGTPTQEEAVATLREAYKKAIEEADLITVDIGINNFGVYASNQIVSNMYENDLNTIDPELAAIYAEGKAYVMAVLEEHAGEYLTILPVDALEHMADTMTYALVGFCLSFDAVMEQIYTLNPDATVAVVSIQNLMYGLDASIAGIEQPLPFGDIFGALINAANVYTATLSPYCGEYVYADVRENGHVEFFSDEILAYDGDPATLSQDVKDCFDVYDDDLYIKSRVQQILAKQLHIAGLLDISAVPAGYDVVGNLEHFGLAYQNDLLTIPALGIALDEFFAAGAAGQLPAIAQPYYDGYVVALNTAYDVMAEIMQAGIAIDTLDASSFGQSFGSTEDELLDVIFETLEAAVGASIADPSYSFDLDAYYPDGFFETISATAGLPEGFVNTVAAMGIRTGIGNSFFGHPNGNGQVELKEAIVTALENNVSGKDVAAEELMKALETAKELVAEYYDEAYAYAYAEAYKAGYIDDAVAGIDGVIAVLGNIDLDAVEMTDELKVKVTAEIVEIIEILEAAKDLVKNADELDQETLDLLLATLTEAGEAMTQLGATLTQAGVDVNQLVIIPALEEAYNKLTNEVLPEINNNLKAAIAVGTEWLMDKAEEAIDALVEALPEMAQYAHDYVYDYLYNNPEKVIAFFNEYGDEIIAAVGEYGPYALVAVAFIADSYGNDTLNFVMENDEEILEVTAMLLKEHGPHAVQLIQVYAEELGYCQAVRDLIADLEDQIADLKAQLEDELKAQLEDLKAELEDLYAQLENASDDVKEQIQNAIEEVEKLIDEVEQKIAEIEAAIAELEAQLEAAQKALEEAIEAVEAVVEAIKTAIENGVETVEEILEVIDEIVKVAEDTIAGVKTAIEGIQNAVEDIVDFVDELIANGIVAAEMIEEIIDTVMDIIDGVKAGLEQGDIDAAIEAIRNELTNGYEELSAMLAAIDTAIAEELDAIIGDLEAALAQAQDEFEEALYNATHGELACDAKTIAVYGGETVATEDGYAAIVAEEWGLTQTEAVDMADVILYQADPQIFVTALLNSVSGEYAADWTKYISDESVLAYLERAKAELKDVLADEYGEEAAAVAEPLVDSFLFAVVEYAIANIETIEYLSRINEDALIVAAGMYNPVQGLSVTYGGETIDIEAMCQYLIEVTDVYNLLYAIAAQNAVFVDVSEAEAAMMSNVDVDSLMARVMELRAEAIALLKEATKALEENDMAKANALMAQAEALYAQVDEIVEDVMPLVESLDSSYATEAGHAYIAEQILAAIEKADHECEWAIDDNEHCYYCVNCGEEFVCGAHEFDGEEDTVCDVCGYTRVIFDDPEVTTSSIVVFYWNENNAAIKEATVEEITTTGSYAFNIPAIDNYNFVNVIDKDENDDNDYDVAQDNTSFTVNVNTMPTSGSALEFVLKYVAAGGGEEDETIAVTGVALDKETLSLKVGNTAALTATVTPDNATNKAVTWASSDESVATVADGVVTAVAKGTATITVTTVDGSFTDTCAVTVTTSGGGSFGGGGGGGYIKPAKPEVLVPDNAVADGVTVTVDHIDYLTVNEVKDLVAKDDNLEVIGGRDSGALVAVKPANAVTSFAHPVQLTVPVSKSALQNVDDVNKLTLALVTTDAQGNIQLTYVGGNYDASKGTFIAYVNQPGKYVLMEKLDIVKLELTIDRYVVFVNGEPIINDVPSRIVNNRTIVPAARVLHHMGCTVEWLSDTRTVAVTLPNGDVLNLPVDEPIPGFGAAPVIENGRTLVPIAYIADMMDAHVQWVGNDRKVIIVK